MAKKKVSELTEKETGFTDNDLLAVVNSGQSWKVKFVNFLAWIASKAITFAQQITFTSAPKFNSVGASKYLITNATNELLGIDTIPFEGIAQIENYIVVTSLDSLPTPVGDVITIPTKTTLFFPNEFDLEGNRLVFGIDCTILGTSSETSKVSSTLGNNIALITATGSIPIKQISFEVNPAGIGDVPIVFDLDGIAEPLGAIDWDGVNVVKGKIGSIKNYNNAIFKLCGFLQAEDGVTFDGTFSTIAFETCIFSGITSGTSITIPSTAIINRRIRLENTPFVCPTGVTGLNVSTSAFIPTEGYIAKFVNFSGVGTYSTGVQTSDNKSLFIECRGVVNSTNITQYYMTGNATATTIASTATYVKIAGTTTNGSYIQKFTNTTTNRTTYTGKITRFFKVSVFASLTSGVNNVVHIVIAKNDTIINKSVQKGTAQGTGRAENIPTQDIVELSENDYIEIFTRNETAVNNITVSELSVILTPLN